MFCTGCASAGWFCPPTASSSTSCSHYLYSDKTFSHKFIVKWLTQMNKQANRRIHRRLDEQTDKQRNKQTTRWTLNKQANRGRWGDVWWYIYVHNFNCILFGTDRRKIWWKIMINSKREVIYWNTHWLKKMKKKGKIYLIVAYLK